MADIVDNRKTKPATENRQRYIEREKDRIQRAIRHTLKKVGIGDLKSGKDVDLEVAKDYSEEHIGIDQGAGVHRSVGTGNTDHQVGDTWELPRDGEGNGLEGSIDAEDENANFHFTMTAKEFMDIFFDMYSLDFLPKQITIEEDGTDSYQHAGFVSEGPPSKLNVVRTYRNSIGRSLAEKQDYLDQISKTDDEEEIKLLEEKINNIPLFRDVDLKFTYSVPEPIIRHRCVMFCIMDVSGSMEEHQRGLAKQFFLLVYVFLQRAYTDVELVFIRHTTEAEEVDEQTFFYEDLSGGTKMSSPLVLMEQIIKARFDPEVYNIYGIHAGDGGNYSFDDDVYYQMLEEVIKPVVTTYVYIETPSPYYPQTSGFYKKLITLALPKRQFRVGHLRSITDIWKVFVQIFQKPTHEFDLDEEDDND